jgi:hypothetical protein
MLSAFDVPRWRGVLTSSQLPSNPAAFKPNAGLPILANLAFLFLPHPSGFYYDIVKGRRAIFGGANASGIVPVLTKFGYGYQFGVAAGGQTAYAGAVDVTAQPPLNGMSIAVGCYNQASIGNVTCELCGWHDPTITNNLILFIGNSSGTPRMQINCGVAGTNTFVTMNGGAGVTMTTSGQYISAAASYNGASILGNYNTTGLGNQTGSGTKTGWPANMSGMYVGNNNGSNFNSARTMLWMAGWNRALSAAELVTVCAPVGGLPAGWLRHG